MLKPKVYSQPVIENFTLVTTKVNIVCTRLTVNFNFQNKDHIIFSDRVVYIFTLLIQN